MVRVHPMFILLKVRDEFGRVWLLMLVYGHLFLCKQKETWGLFSKVLKAFNLPLVVMGDYNQAFEQSDKMSSFSSGIVGQIRQRSLLGSLV